MGLIRGKATYGEESSILIFQMVDYAHILAGKSTHIGDDLLCHQKFSQRSVLEYTIVQAQEAGLSVVSTVRDEKRVQKESLYPTLPVILLEARERLIDSVLYGLVDGIVKLTDYPAFSGDWGNQHFLKEYIRVNPEIQDLAVLYTSSDMPCIRKEDFLTIIQEYLEKGQPDVLVMTTQFNKVQEADAALQLHLGQLESTLENTISTDQGELRISNMYVLKPFKLVLFGLAGSLQKMYEHRHISEGITAWLGAMSGLGKLFARGMANNPWNTLRFLQQTYRSVAHLRGNKRDKVVRLGELEQRASRFGLDIKVSTKGSVATLMDVDDEATLLMYRERYQDIMDFLAKQKV